MSGDENYGERRVPDGVRLAPADDVDEPVPLEPPSQQLLDDILASIPEHGARANRLAELWGISRKEVGAALAYLRAKGTVVLREGIGREAYRQWFIVDRSARPSPEARYKQAIADERKERLKTNGWDRDKLLSQIRAEPGRTLGQLTEACKPPGTVGVIDHWDARLRELVEVNAVHALGAGSAARWWPSTMPLPSVDQLGAETAALADRLLAYLRRRPDSLPRDIAAAVDVPLERVREVLVHPDHAAKFRSRGLPAKYSVAPPPASPKASTPEPDVDEDDEIEERPRYPRTPRPPPAPSPAPKPAAKVGKVSVGRPVELTMSWRRTERTGDAPYGLTDIREGYRIEGLAAAVEKTPAPVVELPTIAVAAPDPAGAGVDSTRQDDPPRTAARRPPKRGARGFRDEASLAGRVRAYVAEHPWSRGRDIAIALGELDRITSVMGSLVNQKTTFVRTDEHPYRWAVVGASPPPLPAPRLTRTRTRPEPRPGPPRKPESLAGKIRAYLQNNPWSSAADITEALGLEEKSKLVTAALISDGYRPDPSFLRTTGRPCWWALVGTPVPLGVELRPHGGVAAPAKVPVLADQGPNMSPASREILELLGRDGPLTAREIQERMPHLAPRQILNSLCRGRPTRVTSTPTGRGREVRWALADHRPETPPSLGVEAARIFEDLVAVLRRAPIAIGFDLDSPQHIAAGVVVLEAEFRRQRELFLRVYQAAGLQPDAPLDELLTAIVRHRSQALTIPTMGGGMSRLDLRLSRSKSNPLLFEVDITSSREP